jgi:hypothetical protein
MMMIRARSVNVLLEWWTTSNPTYTHWHNGGGGGGGGGGDAMPPMALQNW